MSIENPNQEKRDPAPEKDYREMPDGTMLDATGLTEAEVKEEKDAYKTN